jgi:hypothetical protein
MFKICRVSAWSVQEFNLVLEYVRALSVQFRIEIQNVKIINTLPYRMPDKDVAVVSESDLSHYGYNVVAPLAPTV